MEVSALDFSPNHEILGGKPKGSIISFSNAAIGTADGVDVLDAYRDLASLDPDIVIGPDTIGTLSFTSGSTGIPKGVQGRHFSLTHFFPWMGERFGLSEESKFTMLSGIAHDPIQRDSAFSSSRSFAMYT